MRYLLSIALFLLITSRYLPHSAKCSPFCHDEERVALLEFKQSFVVDCTRSYKPSFGWIDLSTWTIKPDFNSIPRHPKVIYWGSRHNARDQCCDWDGVECDKSTGRVVGLDLSSSCLFGDFPKNSSLFQLHHLQKLSLANNHFNFSEIPIGFASLSRLTNLNLSYSVFSGQIPYDFAKLSKLVSLDLSYNVDPWQDAKPLLKLRTLSLENLVSNMSTLEILSLDMVDVPSTVPSLLANLTSLRSLSLSYCDLYGNFPPNIFHLPKLENLAMSHNSNLKGSLLGFSHGSPLRSLDLSWTLFSGYLPTSIGELESLQSLNLEGSQFTGSLPASFGNLSNLENLVLHQNKFTGRVPPSISNLTQVTAFSLSDNFIVADQELFAWLSKLAKLILLGLGSTEMKGTIPSAFSNLTDLKVLSFRYNQLSGPIPPWLGNLTQLRSFDADNNLLSGQLPRQILKLVNLEALTLPSNVDLLVDFDLVLKLPSVQVLVFSRSKVKLPSITSTNYSSKATYPQIQILKLQSCNLTEFPHFLQSQHELEELHFDHNKIQGRIPLWLLLHNVGTLRMLSLSDNSITGFERPQLWLQQGSLTAVFLNDNSLEGPLVFPSSTLKVFLASNNKLGGHLPRHVCKLRSLMYLDVSGNNMSGEVLPCLGDLGGSLIAINLRGNNFHGEVPMNYTKSCKLKMINLSENQLKGTLPRSLANCKQLEELDIGRNKVYGTFPSWLGALPSLQILVLRSNNFHGPITSPNFDLEFSKLRLLDISNNFHMGLLPFENIRNWHAMKATKNDQGNTSEAIIAASDLNNWNGLDDYGPIMAYRYSITVTVKGNEMLYPKILDVFKAIDLSGNKFEGKIPNDIGLLAGLQALNLSNNNIEGGIPLSLREIQYIESLDLSSNKLTGQIPQRLTCLTSLEVFNVSHNQLEGPIPHLNQFGTFDFSSFDDNPGLCGNPLPKSCGNNVDELSPLPSTLSNEEAEDDTYFDSIMWIVISLGYGSGAVVGFIVGKIVTDSKHEWFLQRLRKFQ